MGKHIPLDSLNEYKKENPTSESIQTYFKPRNLQKMAFLTGNLPKNAFFEPSDFPK